MLLDKAHYFHTKLHFQKPMLRKNRMGSIKNWPVTKNAGLPPTASFSWAFNFSLRVSYKYLCIVIIHVVLQSEFKLYNCLNFKELRGWSRGDAWRLSDSNGMRASITQFVNKHSTINPNWLNDSVALWVLICTVHLTVCHVRVAKWIYNRWMFKRYKVIDSESCQTFKIKFFLLIS